MDKLLSPDFGLTFWTLVVFGLLVVVLTQTAWKPLITALEERESNLKAERDAAEAARKAAEALRADLEKQLTAIAASAADALAKAQKAGYTPGERESAQLADGYRKRADASARTARSLKGAPAERDLGSAPPTANLAVGSGLTTATFTNATSATIEICKLAADAPTATQTFQFSVGGAAPISVQAGHCSPPIAVPSGTVSVRELDKNNFRLVGVTAIGPGHENRLLSGSATNPALASVPAGGVENETVLTFTNAVATGQFKICKVSSEPSLQGVTFTFSYSYVVNGSTINGTAALKPGECSGLSSAVPVVDAAGHPIPITVTEGYASQVQVSNIAVANGNSVSTNPANRTATFSVNQGFTVVTFTNVRAPA